MAGAAGSGDGFSGARRGAGQLAESDRSRLLDAMVSACREHGAGRVSIEDVLSRSGVPRAGFGECFGSVQECLLAAVDDALACAAARVVPVYRSQRGWRDAIRAGLHELLLFIDEQRPLALLLLVDALVANDPLLARRARVVAVLADAVDHGRGVARAPASVTRSTAEGAVGGVLCILHARLARDPQAQLAELAGELMSVIVAPYLGPVAVSRELRRPPPRPGGPSASGDPLDGLNLRLTDRTLLVLRAIAARPGANNRQVAQGAGIADPGQTSKLLTRLQQHALIENGRPTRAKGEPNAWKLTRRGASVQWAASRRVR